MDDGKIAYYLELWRDWMRSYKANLGFPTKATGFLSGGIHSVDDWEEEGDWEAAKIVDAAIKDVGKEVPMCVEAIHRRWLGTKSMLNPLAIDMYYGLAVQKLDKKLQKRGLY